MANKILWFILICFLPCMVSRWLNFNLHASHKKENQRRFFIEYKNALKFIDSIINHALALNVALRISLKLYINFVDLQTKIYDQNELLTEMQQQMIQQWNCLAFKLLKLFQKLINVHTFNNNKITLTVVIIIIV